MVEVDKIRRSPGAVAYTVASDSAWLSNSVASGSTAGTCDVSVNALGLAPGVYQGNLTCSAPGGVPGVASVTLIVNALLKLAAGEPLSVVWIRIV